MKLIHRFQFKVEAPIESIYRNMLSAERWLSFVPGYHGLESGDANWPNEGSSIVIRFSLGPWTALFKDTVVEHERGRRFLIHEEAWSGRYIDDVEVSFEAEDGTTKITFIRHVTSKSMLVRILILLLYPLRLLVFWPLLASHVKRKIKAMVET